MKNGKTLTELAAELDRQSSAKKDYIADTTALAMAVKGGAGGDESTEAETEESATGQALIVNPHVVLDGLNGEGKLIGGTAHEQIAAHLRIPKPYYDRMLTEEPALLAENVNVWLHGKSEKRMVRTLDGRARAFLSDRYRPLDNFDLAQAALPVIVDVGAEIISSELTERRMYVKVVLRSLEAEVRGSRQVGDVVQGGIVISNSEIGSGAIRVEPFLYRLVCLNGMIRTDSTLRKYHVGRAAEAMPELEAAYEHFTSHTRKLDDIAFFAKVQDVVRGAFNEDAFRASVDRLSEAATTAIESKDIVKVVEVTRRRFGLSESTGGSILQHLIQGGDLSKWGLANAVTRTAEDQESYDDATALERMGGQVIELPATDWKLISQAA